MTLRDDAAATRRAAPASPSPRLPDTGETVTEILDRVRPADYNGLRLAVGGANNIGLMPAPAPPPPITMAGRQALRVDRQPAPPRRPRPPAGPQSHPVPARQGHHPEKPRPRRPHLPREGRPGTRRPLRNRRTTAMIIVDEAAELLRCGGQP